MPRTILEQWEITAEELTEIVEANPSIRGMLFGYVAEHQLRRFVQRVPEVSRLWKEDDHDRRHSSDLYVVYKGRPFSIESKSLQTNTIKLAEDVCTASCQCDKSDNTPVTLPNGDQIRTTCLTVGGFDILAVNLFPILDRWQFIFALNEDLPRSTYRGYTPEQRQYILKSLIPITWPIPEGDIFTTDLVSLLDNLIASQRQESSYGSS